MKRKVKLTKKHLNVKIEPKIRIFCGQEYPKYIRKQSKWDKDAKKRYDAFMEMLSSVSNDD